MNLTTRTLYRPVNQVELDLIKALNWRGFPPRLPEQPIFYPVLNAQYAREINEKWNVPAYGVGYLLKFEVDETYLSQFEIQNVGAQQHDELWVPAGELEIFNSHIVGAIEILETQTKN